MNNFPLKLFSKIYVLFNVISCKPSFRKQDFNKKFLNKTERNIQILLMAIFKF